MSSWECWAPIIVYLPHRQLRTYVGRSDTTIGVTRVLQPHTKIERFSYRASALTPIDKYFFPEKHIPHLHSLDVDINPSALPWFLVVLSLPALQYLRIKGATSEVLNSVTDFVRGSSCNLTTLSLPSPTQCVEVDVLLRDLSNRFATFQSLHLQRPLNRFTCFQNPHSISHLIVAVARSYPLDQRE